MSLWGKLFSLFPMFYLTVLICEVYLFLEEPHYLSFVFIPLTIYLLPMLLFRLINLFLPLRDGLYDLKEKKVNAWWISHMLQYPFIALPWLESLLHFVPGLYSVWLRGWGARIGRGIYWTPRTEIVDRPLIEVGDNTVIGHISVFVSHLIETRRDKIFLVVKSIKIGKNCLISADAQLGPGANIPDNTKTAIKARLYWRGEWK